MIDKIRKIKYSRLTEEEKFFYDIFSNLEEIKLKDKWTTTVFYRYNGDLIILKKLNKNLIYIDDRIFHNYKDKFFPTNKGIIPYNQFLIMVSYLIKQYLNWDEENVKIIDNEHLFMINEEI